MCDNHENKNMGVSFLAGIGLGALIGAVVALLTAPKSGYETRNDLKNAGEDLKSKAEKIAHDISSSSTEVVKKGKEILEVSKEKGKDILEVGKEKVNEVIEVGRKTINCDANNEEIEKNNEDA
jgi:gas vesicle protein